MNYESTYSIWIEDQDYAHTWEGWNFLSNANAWANFGVELEYMHTLTIL